MQSVTLCDRTLPSITLNHLIPQISDLNQLQIYHIWSNKSSLSTDIGRFQVKMSAGGCQRMNKNLPSQTLMHLIQQIPRWKEVHMENVASHDDKNTSVHPLSARVLRKNYILVEFHQ